MSRNDASPGSDPDQQTPDSWIGSIPVLDHFAHVADPNRYSPLPDDWVIAVADVVDSSRAIADGRYKAVNLAGAGTISAVTNALDGKLRLFSFGGDGASFAIPPAQESAARDALARVAAWASRDLDLDLRVGMTTVAEIRAAGADVRAAFWKASDNVQYTMFTGRGVEWAEEQLKKDIIRFAPAPPHEEPDLTGLSCQWGPIRPQHGNVVSLIVKPASGADPDRFGEITAGVIALLERSATLNPVPANGPEIRWPSSAIGLQSDVAQDGRTGWQRRLRVIGAAAAAWIVFKLGRRIGSFDPDQYRREIAENTDFRKFDDALMMTVDCSDETIEELRGLLDSAQASGAVRYGLHIQDEALMTCVAPSIMSSDHIHFVDGAGGGYASAASKMRE